jgi:ABC-type branched-subunit amino acid transport system substrate-binding protein
MTASVVGCIAVLGMAVVGCGDSDSSDSNKSSGSTAAGAPILIGTQMPLSGQVSVQPQLKAGMQAAVSAVNAAGGIHGHPLKLQICDTKFDTNAELACVRGLIVAKVAAVVGGTIVADQSGREFQLLSKAGIPYVGSPGDVPAEYTTPGVFPLSSGYPGWVYGGTKNLVAKGSKKIGLFALNSAAGHYGAKMAEAALTSVRMKPAATAFADPQADPTFASAAAKASAGGVDGISLLLVPPLVPKALTALKNAGYSGRIQTLSALATPAVLKAAGSGAEGIFVTAQSAFPTDTSNPGIKSFLSDMKKYQPGAAIEEFTVQGWSAIKLFAKVMSDAPTKGDAAPTSAQILAAFNAINKPVELGTIGPFGPPPTKPYAPGFDRMFSATVQNGVVKGGVPQPDGKGYVNPFTAGSN